jgi:hypothetical protein
MGLLYLLDLFPKVGLKWLSLLNIIFFQSSTVHFLWPSQKAILLSFTVWVRRGLINIFLEGIFSLLRYKPWMLLTEMCCRAGNTAYSCSAVREGFLCRRIFMSRRVPSMTLQFCRVSSHIPRLDGLVRMVPGMGPQANQSGIGHLELILIFFKETLAFQSSEAIHLISAGK